MLYTHKHVLAGEQEITVELLDTAHDVSKVEHEARDGWMGTPCHHLSQHTVTPSHTNHPWPPYEHLNYCLLQTTQPTTQHSSLVLGTLINSYIRRLIYVINKNVKYYNLLNLLFNYKFIFIPIGEKISILTHFLI